MTRAHAMHAPHHEGRARSLSLCPDLYTIRWRLSIPLFRKPIAWRRAHAMARGLRDPTTSHQETSIGMGPDSAQHGSLVDGSQSYARTPIQPGWSVQYDATQNPYVAPLATPQQHFYPCEPERTSSFVGPLTVIFNSRIEP